MTFPNPSLPYTDTENRQPQTTQSPAAIDHNQYQGHNRSHVSPPVSPYQCPRRRNISESKAPNRRRHITTGKDLTITISFAHCPTNSRNIPPPFNYGQKNQATWLQGTESPKRNAAANHRGTPKCGWMEVT